MKILNENPPNYEDVKEKFPLTGNEIFTYGEHIYNPNKFKLSSDLLVHEMVHVKQQGLIGTKEWWRRYLSESGFRLSQEVEAYHAQYRFYCSITKDRNKRDNFLSEIAKVLSSPVYGSIIGYMEARKMIKNG